MAVNLLADQNFIVETAGRDNLHPPATLPEDRHHGA